MAGLTGAALVSMIALGTTTPYLPIALLLAVAGLGQGLAIPPASAAALEIVARERSGIGTATVAAARQVGTALGIAVLGTILASHLGHLPIASLTGAFTNGLHPSMLVAGTTVLAATVLLAVMPAPRTPSAT